MLDVLEEHAGERLSGIDLGEIDWFHKLRNELYHNGNGLLLSERKSSCTGKSPGLRGVALRDRAFVLAWPALRILADAVRVECFN
jgi:hypothetical protein